MKEEKKIDPWFDKTKPLKERKELFAKEMDKMMNPFPKESFDAREFEPMAGSPEAELVDRVRKIPNKLLPTNLLEPKEIREGQMIGMYESKQDIYLILAHRNNELQAQVDDLQEQINKLKK